MVMLMRLTFHIGRFTVTIIVKSNNRHYCVYRCVTEIEDFDTSSIGQVTVVNKNT